MPPVDHDHNHWYSLMSAAYDAGFKAGHASRDAEFDALQRVADYWYFRACNPGVKSPEEKIVDSIIDGMEVNERWEKKRQELDDAEAALFEEARVLMADGMDDLDIAKKVGLFLPVVANIRAGAL